MRTGFRLLLAFMLVSIFLLSAIPKETSAIPYKIEGYLKNSDEMPIVLANISITGRYYNNSIQGFQTATSYVITNSEGYFKLYIAAAEPGGYETGGEMSVSYRSGDDTVSKVITIQGIGVWANLTFEAKPNLLDALSSPAGLVIMVLSASVILVGYYIYHSSGDKSNIQDKKEERPKRVERRRRQR